MAAIWQKTKYPGVRVRHATGCAGTRCRCTPSYRGEVWDGQLKRPAKGPATKDINEARSWVIDYQRGAITRTTTGKPITFRQLAEKVMDELEAGRITNKQGNRFSERTTYSYRSTLELHVYPDYGNALAGELAVKDWQRLIDRLSREGRKTNTINNILNPVRSIYRWACSPARETPLPVNPTVGLEMPARDEKRRDRIAPPAEAAQLLAALPLEDRVPYALAMYAGLRRVEVSHADWSWIDFDRGTVSVRVTKGGTAGERRVPLIDPLRTILREGWMAAGQPEAGLVCPPRKMSDSGLMSFDMLLKRARSTWTDAELQAIGLHECRHTFASYLIAAGVNAKAITTYLGHSSVDITFDRYGHLFPGNEDEAAQMLNTWMQKAVAK